MCIVAFAEILIISRHAGLVNVCGNAIDISLKKLLLSKNQGYSLTHWLNLSPSLFDSISSYPTSHKMIKDLKEHRDTVYCLRMRFLGSFANKSKRVAG
jgi:hypothetical protein